MACYRVKTPYFNGFICCGCETPARKTSRQLRRAIRWGYTKLKKGELGYMEWSDVSSFLVECLEIQKARRERKWKR